MANKEDFHPIPGSPISLRRVQQVAENQYFQVFMDEVAFSDGRQGTHLRIREPQGGVAVLVVNENEELYLHRAYHYAGNVFALEIIRGFGQMKESAEQTALREFAEEAAFKAETIGPPRLLGKIYPNSTLLMTEVPVFLIRVSLAQPAAPAETSEGLHGGRWYSVQELWQAVGRGEIQDAFTLSALALLEAHRQDQADG